MLSADSPAAENSPDTSGSERAPKPWIPEPVRSSERNSEIRREVLSVPTRRLSHWSGLQLHVNTRLAMRNPQETRIGASSPAREGPPARSRADFTS